MNITLERGRFGWDYVVVADDGQNMLVQSDYDYPGLAATFGWTGWTGSDADIPNAQDYLDNAIGETTEDPGYFG